MRVIFRLYAQLNDPLPRSRRQRAVEVDVPPFARLDEALRGLKVRPESVGLVLVNGEPSSLERVLEQGDRVAAYPPFAQLAMLPC